MPRCSHPEGWIAGAGKDCPESLIGQLGWVILVQTLGWMAGLKIAVLGIGGYGALGGAVTWLGAAAIGTAVALPGTALLVDGTAYRKTVLTTLMLLAKTRPPAQDSSRIIGSRR